MATVATLPSSTTVQHQPPEPSIEQIDAGIDDDLVAAAFEDLDDDPIVASLQTDRDRLAARGDMDGARAHHRQVQEMRQTQAAADRAAKLEALADLAVEQQAETEVQA